MWRAKVSTRIMRPIHIKSKLWGKAGQFGTICLSSSFWIWTSMKFRFQSGSCKKLCKRTGDSVMTAMKMGGGGIRILIWALHCHSWSHFWLELTCISGLTATGLLDGKVLEKNWLKCHLWMDYFSGNQLPWYLGKIINSQSLIHSWFMVSDLFGKYVSK